MSNNESKKEKIKIFEEKLPPKEVEVEIPARPEEIEKRVEEIEKKPAETEEIKEEVALVPPIGQREEVLPKDKILKEIEEVLEEDLGEIYLEMTPEQQKIFKEKGEETASKIRILIQQVKIHIKEILNLIKKWLSYIPGVNKFFLEQEAKIKTDKILEIAERKNEL